MAVLRKTGIYNPAKYNNIPFYTLSRRQTSMTCIIRKTLEKKIYK